jgi:hypothetical protein
MSSGHAEKHRLELDISNAIHRALTNGIDPVDVLDVLRGHVAEVLATIKAARRSTNSGPR